MAVRNEMEATQLVRDLERLLACGGFNLTKWISNSPAVMENIKPERRAKGLAQVELGDASEERVLGMRWNVLEDNFQFNVKIPERPPTRRGLLAVTNAVFDPLGLVCPVVLEARLIFRSACQRKIGWDEPVPAAEAIKWDKWKNSLCALNDLKLSRCFKGSATAKDMQLHAFADASTAARGAVGYLRYIDCNQQVCCSLIMAKSLLAGSGNHTVPRLELEAALDVVKLVKVVRSELELGACPCIYWTDSTIVLQSLRAESKRFPVFSRNRLSQIERRTCVYDWHHVPSGLNPADLASRGCTAGNLVTSKLWINGPGFLRDSPERWPQLPLLKGSDDDSESYKVFDIPKKASASLLATAKDVETSPTDYFIGYFSFLDRLKVATAGLLCVKVYWLNRIRGVAPERSMQSPITVEELQNAEMELIKYVQNRSFPEWFRKNDVTKKKLKSDVLLPLNPIVVEGVLRVGG